MNKTTLPLAEATAYRNFYRLFMLRNVEILGIGLGIVAATSYFDIVLPLPPLLFILGLITGLSLYNGIRLRSGRHFDNGEIFTLMLLDIAGLTAVFYYTGGASNPFVWFYLLPLMIAATILPRWQTWLMAALTVLCYSAFLLIAVPATGEHEHHALNGFHMHVIGMWLGFVLSAGFISVIIVGMAQGLRERDRKLAEAREQALRDQRLVELGTLAAGTAHELGTPLGTMAILASELEQEFAGSGDRVLSDRLGTLNRQIARCKQTLSKLSAAAGAQRAESGHAMEVRRYLDEVIAEWQQQRPEARLQVDAGDRDNSSRIIAERTLSQALINILNNAADASPEDVSLRYRTSDNVLGLEVSDRGPGLSGEIHHQLGRQPVSTKEEGLGVGLFLSRATIERLGGSLSIRNREDGGTTLDISIPLLT